MIKTVPYTHLSHPFIERLIGTIRREFLDHTLFWNAADLERKLDDFQAYYNQHRSHCSLGGATTAELAGGDPKQLNTLDNCRGYTSFQQQLEYQFAMDRSPNQILQERHP